MGNRDHGRGAERAIGRRSLLWTGIVGASAVTAASLSGCLGARPDDSRTDEPGKGTPSGSKGPADLLLDGTPPIIRPRPPVVISAQPSSGDLAAADFTLGDLEANSQKFALVLELDGGGWSEQIPLDPDRTTRVWVATQGGKRGRAWWGGSADTPTGEGLAVALSGTDGGGSSTSVELVEQAERWDGYRLTRGRTDLRIRLVVRT